MWIQSRFGSSLDLHGGTNVVARCSCHSGVPEQQSLLVWVVRVQFQAELIGSYGVSSDCVDLRRHAISNIVLACGADAFQADAPLLAAQGVQFRSFSGFADVFAEYGDVDVL